jgi:LmbE family N-acetylglucosaminyl deacetylase
MRWIYLSPHFDDAVLSCGGLISEQTRQGIPVEIWTICAGDPPPGSLSRMAKKIHKEWGTGNAEETVFLRRSEDREAASRVGAGVFHSDTPDCIYRRGSDGTLLYTVSVFDPWNPLEKDLHAHIAEAISVRLQPEDVVVCPLAIGSHVDHIFTRRAIESLGLPLLYYADIPYLLNRPRSLHAVSAGLTGKTHLVSGESLRAWLAGIAAYRSQIGMLFKTERRMRVAIAHYWESRHGVRLWRVL